MSQGANEQLVRAKYLAQNVIEKSDGTPTAFIGMEDVLPASGRLASSYDELETKSASDSLLVQRDDVLFGKLRPYLSKSLLVSEIASCTGEFLVLRATSRTQPRYLYYLTLSQPWLGWAAATSYGSKMPRTSWELMSALKVAPLSVDEQSAIADFLDRETAKIDALIGKQEQLIATLREDRIATITHAVTKGLDPNAEMKDSGVEWLGEIPAHWEMVNIRRAAVMKTGHTPSRSTQDYWANTSIPWFTLADVWQLRDGRQLYLGDTKEQISEIGLKNSAAELLPASTVVLSRTASVGFSGIVPIPMATSQDFWNWVCGPRLVPEYLLFVFRSMYQHFSALTMGSTHKTIYQPDAAAIKIPLPPTDEQREIINRIGERIPQIDALVTKSEQMIETLREYRSALITDAVTGKIDVRGAA